MTEPTPDPAQNTPAGAAAQPTDGGEATPQLTVEELQAKLDQTVAESRKWEARSKENLAKATEFEKARKAAMTEAERAVAEAEERGRMSAVTAYGERLARTEWIAEAARRNPGFDAAGALEDLNVAKFIGDDGEPIGKAIAASVARLVPEGATGPTPPPSFDGGTRQPATAGTSMNQLIRGATGRA